MEQTVYVDLFFIINFSMDFLCFFLASSLLSQRFSIARSAIASGVGGLYACVALFLSLGGTWGVILDIVACFAMSAIAVKKKGNIREVGVYALVFTACSILLGGFMTVLFSLFNKIGLDRFFGSESDSDGVSVWLFALIAALGGVISLFGGRFFKRKSARQRCEVELIFDGKSIVLDAFCDSGNLLTDPISSKPCIIAEKMEVEKILPRDVSSRVRVIPTQTVNGRGILYAVRPDRVRINAGKGWSDVEALVALAELNATDGAKALVPSVLLLGAP